MFVVGIIHTYLIFMKEFKKVHFVEVKVFIIIIIFQNYHEINIYSLNIIIINNNKLFT